jgi:hypothetical protein
MSHFGNEIGEFCLLARPCGAGACGIAAAAGDKPWTRRSNASRRRRRLLISRTISTKFG